MNQAVSGIASGTRNVGSIIHLAGRAAAGDMQRRATKSSLPWVCLPYEPQMEFFYAAVDLVVARAGAMTVSELAATGTPSLLVPLARVGQQWNAFSLSDVGGATVVAEGDTGSLPSTIDTLVADERALAAMSRAARSQAFPDAAGVIADRLIEVANG